MLKRKYRNKYRYKGRRMNEVKIDFYADIDTESLDNNTEEVQDLVQEMYENLITECILEFQKLLDCDVYPVGTPNIGKADVGLFPRCPDVGDKPGEIDFTIGMYFDGLADEGYPFDGDYFSNDTMKQMDFEKEFANLVKQTAEIAGEDAGVYVKTPDGELYEDIDLYVTIDVVNPQRWNESWETPVDILMTVGITAEPFLVRIKEAMEEQAEKMRTEQMQQDARDGAEQLADMIENAVVRLGIKSLKLVDDLKAERNRIIYKAKISSRVPWESDEADIITDMVETFKEDFNDGNILPQIETFRVERNKGAKKTVSYILTGVFNTPV